MIAIECALIGLELIQFLLFSSRLSMVNRKGFSLSRGPVPRSSKKTDVKV
jgi:hypothetical protein